jgi:hypothetical protein
MDNIQKEEVHVSKLITEMPKLKMTHNARLVLYAVLKKSWQTFRKRENYIFKDKLSPEDIKEAQKPVTLKLYDLKPLFRSNTTFKDIKEHILTIPYEAIFNTNIDINGRKRNELLEVKISLFKKVEVSNKEKEITFQPSDNLIFYLEALKSFARIDIEELKKLRGNYQVRGYEFICQNNYLDKNGNKLIDDEARKIRVEDLRRYFEVPNTYDIGRIDQRVLNPVKKAINKHTKYNIVDIKKFKLDPRNKCRVTHYRIDVEYKQKNNNKIKENEKKSEFEKIWDLYPLQKGKGDLTKEVKKNIEAIGYDKMKIYIERYVKYVEERRKEFNQSYMNPSRFFKTGYIDYIDENYKIYIANQSNRKPIQSTNFDQRKYDDDFFDSLYDNFKK